MKGHAVGPFLGAFSKGICLKGDSMTGEQLAVCGPLGSVPIIIRIHLKDWILGAGVSIHTHMTTNLLLTPYLVDKRVDNCSYKALCASHTRTKTNRSLWHKADFVGHARPNTCGDTLNTAVHDHEKPLKAIASSCVRGLSRAFQGPLEQGASIAPTHSYR